MKLLEAFDTFFAGEPDPFDDPRRRGDPAGMGYQPIVPPPTQSQALLNATFYACLSLCSGTVARVPLVLYREDETGDDRARDRKHTLYRTLERRPNRYQTAFAWKQTRMVYKLLSGNDVCEIVYGPEGYELIPLRPDRVLIQDLVEDSATAPSFTTWDKTGKPRQLLRDEVLHVPMMAGAFGPGGGKIGRSVYDVARDVLALAKARNDFQQRFFVSGASQRGVLEYPKSWTDKDTKRLKETLAALNGPDGQHGIMLLDNDLKFKSTFVDPQKAQLVESSLLSIADIARLFHMPLPKIGYYKDAATYKSVELLRQDFLDHTIDPHLCADEGELNRTLVVEDGLFAEYLRQALMQADSATRWMTYGIGLLYGVVTGNEVRRAENLPKLPGLDKPRVRLDTQPADREKEARAHESWSGKADDLRRRAARARAAEVDTRRLRGLAEAVARPLADLERAFLASVTAATPATTVGDFYQGFARQLARDLVLPEGAAALYAERRANELLDAAGDGDVKAEEWSADLSDELVGLALYEEDDDV